MHAMHAMHPCARTSTMILSEAAADIARPSAALAATAAGALRAESIIIVLVQQTRLNRF